VIAPSRQFLGGILVRRPLIASAAAILLLLCLFQVAQAGNGPTGNQENPGKHLGWCDPQIPNGSDIKGHPHCTSPTETSGPTPTPTPTETSGPTPTPTPTETSTPTPPPGVGVFTRTPASGPIGTIIRVASVTASPLKGDEVAIVALVSPNPGPIAVVTLPVDSSGAWQGSLVVPSSATPGSYLVTAATRSASGGEFQYAPQSFVVLRSPGGGAQPPTAPAPAQPVPPVVKTPQLTG
jgi:hypothetical protein